jgi:hypothetical protein
MAPPMTHNAAARSRIHRGKSKPKNPKDRRRCRLFTWNSPPRRNPLPRLPPPALRIIFKRAYNASVRVCVSVCLYLLRYELLSLFLVSFEENSKREVREVDSKTP